jgi:hypothetical protein
MATQAEIIDNYKMMVQEPDFTFLSAVQVARLLSQAYDEFRSLVNTYDRNYYATEVTIAPGATEYDLGGTVNAVRILGPGPTADRLSRLVEISDVSTNLPYGALIWQGVGSRRALLNYASGHEYRKYYLQGSVLYFPTTVDQLLVRYIPVSRLVWVIPAVGSVEPDDLVEFHDLISLYAARRYYAIDASTNRQFEAEIKIRERDLINYMAQKRVNDVSEIQREVGLY